MTPHLLVFGPGYAASPIIESASKAGWRVTAACRSAATTEALLASGTEVVDSEAGCLPDGAGVSHILNSAAPGKEGDPMLARWSGWLGKQKQVRSIHYFSSTNVYGDHGGSWVDESTPAIPSLERGKRRVEAEVAWQRQAGLTGARLFIYRLAGIYGPGRNALLSVKEGKARRVIKEGQVFGRIHVDDIAAAVWNALTGESRGGVFNLTDDMPCPPQEVIEAAAAMLGLEPPQAVLFEDADLSPLGRSFYLENKRVGNDKVKAELGLRLRYPSYREGLGALLQTMETDTDRA